MSGLLAICGSALLECRAGRLHYLVALYGLVLAATGLLLPVASPADRPGLLLQLAVALNFGLVGLAICAFCATTISREFSSKMELTIAVKPVGRLTRVLGKFAGAALVALLLVTANGLLGYLLVRGFSPAGAAQSAALQPRSHSTGESGVFDGPKDRTPRALGRQELFSAPGQSRPVWTFARAPEGRLRLSIRSELRQASTTLEAGLINLVARRGSGKAEVHRVRLFGNRSVQLEIDPPGSGPLAVVLHPFGSTLLHPDAQSVLLETGRGSLLGNYAVAQLGVLAAVLVLAGIGLFFSATCGPKPALLYTMVLAMACVSLGPMRTFARVLGDGEAALRQVERSFSQLGSQTHEHEQAGESEAQGHKQWVALEYLLRGLIWSLPDLARYDHRGRLAAGVLIGPRQIARDLVPAGCYLGGLLALAAVGLALTGREGR